jgi:hypothetical protein
LPPTAKLNTSGRGYLFGLTHATEKGALKWNLERERVF